MLVIAGPRMDRQGFQHGFHAADTDHSGHIDLPEFKHLISFIVWLNEQRHLVQELQEAFPDGLGEMEFYSGCQILGFHCSDSDAKYLFTHHLKHEKLGQFQSHDSEGDGYRRPMTFETFIEWAVRYACVTLKGEQEKETPAQARARQIDFLTRELENMAGEFGDIHMVDLVSVMTTKKTDIAHRGPAWKQALTKAVGTASECSHLLAAAFKNSTERNEGFPNLAERSMRAIVQMCTREEYFSGQNIVTEGEEDGRYFVLRRGVVEVIIEGRGKVGSLEWGTGFGEIGLLLHTKRTATVRCTSPCELYVHKQSAVVVVMYTSTLQRLIDPSSDV
jgi:hypothetical protein